MSKGKQRISKTAKNLLNNDIRFNHCNCVAYGDLNILHEIYDKSGFTLKNSHPLNKLKRVLDALDRESKQDNAIFKKTYFRHHGLVRNFTLIYEGE